MDRDLPGCDTDTERRRPGRSPMPGAERCRKICEAAAAVFLRDGYAAATIEEVARLAGMSKRTLYEHFASKTDLFEATVSATLAPLRLESDFEREPDLQVALTGILEAAGRQLLALRHAAIFRVVIAEVQRSPELAEACHRVILGSGASSLERRLAHEIRQQTLSLRDPESAARMLYGMALASTHMLMLMGLREPPDAAEIAELSRQAVVVFLRGAQVG